MTAIDLPNKRVVRIFYSLFIQGTSLVQRFISCKYAINYAHVINNILFSFDKQMALEYS